MRTPRRSTLTPRFVDHGQNLAAGQCLVVEQRLCDRLDIGPKIIDETLGGDFQKRKIPFLETAAVELPREPFFNDVEIVIAAAPIRSRRKTPLCEGSREVDQMPVFEIATAARTDRDLTFIIAPGVDPCAIDRCTDSPRYGGLACDLVRGVFNRVSA